MNDDALSDKILKQFLKELENSQIFPKKLLADLNVLYQQGKLSKGTHLKDLFLNFDGKNTENENI